MILKDKVAIITGSAGGIGRAYALGYAKEGAKLVISDINDGAETVALVEKDGGEAIFVKCDIAKQEDCDALAKAAADRFGGIDILVNNAAMFGGLILRPFTEIGTEEWNKLMSINTTGPFHGVKAVFPYMKDGGGGKIVNISSASVLEGAPGMLHYVASKGAVMAMTRAMARELGPHNISINSIMPGYTMSEAGKTLNEEKQFDIPDIDDIQMPMRCLKRTPYPEDIVGTAIYLGSDMCGMVTGQSIVHDGGMSMH